MFNSCLEGMLGTAAPNIAVIDADFQHDEALLPEMLKTLRGEELDLVVGSRFVPGGGTGTWSGQRLQASHLATWLSFRDLVQLVTRCLVAERIGHTVIYGISDNRERFFSNEKAAHLGYKPQDSAEDYRAEVEAKCPPGDPFAPDIEFAGGFLCAMGHPDDEA